MKKYFLNCLNAILNKIKNNKLSHVINPRIKSC